MKVYVRDIDNLIDKGNPDFEVNSIAEFKLLASCLFSEDIYDASEGKNYSIVGHQLCQDSGEFYGEIILSHE